MPEDIIVECPHCDQSIAIMEINCSIFRHGTLKNYQQIPPHASKLECDMYLRNDQVLEGCAKPFKLIQENGKFKALICDYI